MKGQAAAVVPALIVGLLCGRVLAAPASRIEGTVSTSNGMALAGARVEIEGYGLSTEVDASGHYRFDGLRSGIVLTLVASFPSLPSERRRVYLTEGLAQVDFALQMKTISEQVEVRAEIPPLDTAEKVSSVALTPERMASLPSLGEKDIFRALQLLPGVNGSRETSSGLYVRGGTPSQNLISYDGFTVYHVDHLFGYFTAFNMDAVEEVRLSKAAFEARDGGRLSGVLDLTGKSGRRDRVGGSAGLSLLSAHALAETPLGTKASLIVAGRRSFQGPLYDKILGLFGDQGGGPRLGSPGGGGMAPPGGGGFGRFALFETQPSSYFYDANAKLLWEPTARDHVSVSLYSGRDAVDNSRSLTIPDFMRERMAERGFEPPASFDISDTRRWSNLGLGATWSRSFAHGLETRLSLGHSAFQDLSDRATQASDSAAGDVEDNDLTDLSARFELGAQLGASHLLQAGALMTRNRISYTFQSATDARMRPGFERGPAPPQIGGMLDRDERATQYSGYLQDRLLVAKRITLSPGVRYTYYDGSSAAFFEPRLSVNALVNERLRLKAALGVQHQFANRITREDVTRGNREFWTLSDGDQVPVARARHGAAGLTYESRDILIDVEAFYKKLDGLAQFAPRLAPQGDEGAPDLSTFFYEGSGTARGLELLAQKKFGLNTGWVSYTLSRTDETFLDLDPVTRPASQDQTHELKIADIVQLKRWAFSATWIFATGQPYTAPTGVETTELAEGFAFDRLLLGERNAARLPAYHRLDVAAHFTFTLGKLKASAGLSVFNVYDRRNVWYKEFQVVEGEVLENNITLMSRTFNLFTSLSF